MPDASGLDPSLSAAREALIVSPVALWRKLVETGAASIPQQDL
jgi:hypothetical protein